MLVPCLPCHSVQVAAVLQCACRTSALLVPCLPCPFVQVLLCSSVRAAPQRCTPGWLCHRAVSRLSSAGASTRRSAVPRREGRVAGGPHARCAGPGGAPGRGAAGSRAHVALPRGRRCQEPVRQQGPRGGRAGAERLRATRGTARLCFATRIQGRAVACAAARSWACRANRLLTLKEYRGCPSSARRAETRRLGGAGCSQCGSFEALTGSRMTRSQSCHHGRATAARGRRRTRSSGWRRGWRPGAAPRGRALRWRWPARWPRCRPCPSAPCSTCWRRCWARPRRPRRACACRHRVRAPCPNPDQKAGGWLG